jgi:hypothetical protein
MWECVMDGIDSGSCSLLGFGISGVETGILQTQFISLLHSSGFMVMFHVNKVLHYHEKCLFVVGGVCVSLLNLNFVCVICICLHNPPPQYFSCWSETVNFRQLISD